MTRDVRHALGASRLSTLLAIIHYKRRGYGRHSPCLSCVFEITSGDGEPRYLWQGCAACDWGNE